MKTNNLAAQPSPFTKTESAKTTERNNIILTIRSAEGIFSYEIMTPKRILFIFPGIESYTGNSILAGMQLAAGSIPAFQLQQTAITPHTFDLARKWNPHGMITCIPDSQTNLLKQLMRLDRPIIDISETRNEPHCTYLAIGSHAAGQKAAEYFLNKQFTSFGFIGNTRSTWEESRREGFQSTLKKHGFTATSHFNANLHGPYLTSCENTALSRTAAWLKKKKKPVAIYVSTDHIAYSIIELCRTHNLDVPDEIAVLGTGNDRLICNMSHPTCSSIILPFEELGREAFIQMKKLICHERVADRKIILLPKAIISRESTQTINTPDPLVVNALLFIRSHIHEPINVDQILQHLQISRTLLQTRFTESLKRTPLQEIQRQRIALIKKLLSDSNLTVQEISDTCGFSSPTQLIRMFKKHCGITPNHYRASLS